ncbi:MAG: glycosyltransferase family 4 protein [Anaerolineae bacterium]
MRIAFYSPLNPVPSGISDYSEELLPLLAREFEIELIVDESRPTARSHHDAQLTLAANHPGPPLFSGRKDARAGGASASSNPALASFPVWTRAEFKRRAAAYDLVLYQMGNSPAHDGIYQTLREIPGVVVLHDLVLHHLRAWQTIDRRDVQGYIAAMRADYGEAGAELARLEALGLAGLDRFAYPLNGAVARAARALIVHSAYAAHELARIVPQTPIAVVPMGVPPARFYHDAPTARAHLYLPADAFIVAAFGEVHPHKRVTVALQAFADFHRRFPNSLFLLIGRESANYETDDIIRLCKLEGAVRRIGFAPRADYEDYIAAADLCLNLRYPSAGETSASLLRLFAAGKAVIVTRTGAYADLPDSVCAKIEADEYEQALLCAHLELFAQRPDLIARLGTNARAFAARGHTLEQSAAAYADFLRAVHAADPRTGAGQAKSRSYLVESQIPELGWTAEDRTTPAAEGRRSPNGGRLPVADPRTGVAHAQTGASVENRDLDLMDSIAFDYAELGLDAQDPLLQTVAQALVELGLGGALAP